MAQTTTNYGLYKPESTDTYNHLVYDNPNMDTIDSTMKDNANHAIDSASCIKTGTVHSVTRSNTSCPVFRFTATGDWNTGDTMNVDGTPVSVFLPNGTAAITGAYLINTEVIAAIVGTRVTLMSNAADSASIYFDNTGTTLTASDVEDALKELNNSANIKYDNANSVKDKLDAVGNITTIVDVYGLRITKQNNVYYLSFTGLNAANNDSFPFTPSNEIRFVLYSNTITKFVRGIISNGHIEIYDGNTPVTGTVQLYGSICIIDPQ